MKRSVINSILLALIYVTLVGGVIFLNNPELFQKENEKLKGTVQESAMHIYPVYSGEIEHSFSANGTVGGEDYRRTLVIEGAKVDNTSLSVEKGADFAAAEALASVSAAPVAAPCNGKLIDYRFDAEAETLSMELLDYDALCIRTSLGAEKLDKLGYSTKARAIYRRKKYDVEISYIGYEIENGNVELCVSLPEELRLLPGEEVALEFIIGITDKGNYTFSQAVLFDFDGSPYAYVYGDDGKTLMKRPLTTGETFTVVEDDMLLEFTEIISGAEEGEQLIVEELGGTQLNLEDLING